MGWRLGLLASCFIAGAGRAESYNYYVPPSTKRPVLPQDAAKIKYPGTVSYDGIKKFIAAQKISSVDDLLSRLPAECLNTAVFMHHSQSPESGSVSYAYPRGILSCYGAKVLMAFTCDPANPENFGKLQFIDFDATTASFAPHQIQFPSAARPGAVQFADHPTNCSQCHGSDFHPNWEHYPYWPGAFGAVDDDIVGPVEVAGMATFKKDIQKKDCYRLFEKYDNHSKSDSIGQNARLSYDLYWKNIQRILRQLKSSSHYDKARYRAAWILMSCEAEQGLREKSQREVASLSARYDEILGRLRDETGQKDVPRDSTFRPIYQRPWFGKSMSAFINGSVVVANMKDVARLFGVPYANFSMALNNQGDFVKGVGNNDLRLDLADKIMGELYASDPDIRQSAPPGGGTETQYGSAAETWGGYFGDEKLCALLDRKAGADTDTFVPTAPDISAGPHGPTSAHDLNGQHIVAEKCLDCHATGPMPYIPFGDPRKLRTSLAKIALRKSAAGGPLRLKEDLLSRIQPSTDPRQRMPLGGAALTPAEIAAITRYLDEVDGLGGDVVAPNGVSPAEAHK